MRPRLTSLALAAAALGLTSCGSSPTEPASAGTSRQALTLRVEVLGGGKGGTLSVFNDACGCAPAPIIVTVDGSDVGSVTQCDAATDLPFSSTGGRLVVSARSTDATGNPIESGALAGVMVISGDVQSLSLSVRVGCSTK